MKNAGIVKAADGGKLTIEFERLEACGDCHNCARGSTNCKQHTLVIPGQANPGDVVVVEMDDSHVMLASMVAYMIPLAGFLLGLGAGVLLKVNEGLIALTAIAGTALAYGLMRLLDPIFSRGKWEPRIIEVVPSRVPRKTETAPAAPGVSK